MIGHISIGDRERLARALFDLYRKQACIYSSTQDNDSAWAAEPSERRLWHERAEEMAIILMNLDWRPPEWITPLGIEASDEPR